jgi:hypothetical protein
MLMATGKTAWWFCPGKEWQNEGSEHKNDKNHDDDLDEGESGRSAVRFLFHGRLQEEVNHISRRNARRNLGKAKG